MIIYRTGNRNVVVRRAFTDETEWRNALGNAAPLYCFSLSGVSLDAPEYMPAGGMRSTGNGPDQLQANR